MNKPIELIAVKQGETTVLQAPEVGFFTCSLKKNDLLGAGQVAGVLVVGGRSIHLITPKGTAGRITSERPDRSHEPVAYGTALYELAPIATGDGQQASEDEAAQGSGLLLLATQTGRFYRRPSPDEPAYVEVGGGLAVGQAVGMIEIMKTFSQVNYEARDGLPTQAKLVRWLCEDGAEVREGDPLFEVEAS